MTLSLNRKFILKIVFVFVIIFGVLWGVFTYLLYKESRENDSLPIILTSKVSMERVSNYSYNFGGYRDEMSCSEEEQKSVFQAFKQQKFNAEIQEKYYTCKKFTTARGNFYDAWSGMISIQALFMRTGANIELVIKQTGDYPGNGYKVRGVNGDSIIIEYSGWNNPRKVLKLTIH